MKPILILMLLIFLCSLNLYETADTIKLIRSNMPEDMQIQAMGIVIDEIKNNHSIETIANKLELDFTTVYGGQWFTIVSYGDIAPRFGVSVPNTLLWFSYGNDSVVLFSVHDCRNSVEEINETQIIDQVRVSSPKMPIVIKIEMNDTMKSRAINVTVDAFNSYLTFQEIAAKIVSSLNSTYGSMWHSIVGVRLVESKEDYENGTYLSFRLVNAVIVVFKSNLSTVGV
jgi:hypothetical protein